MSWLVFATRPRWAVLAFCLVLLPAVVRAQSPTELVNQGWRYDNGIGAPRDGAMAQKLYIAAAKANSVLARNNLAYLWARQGGLLEEALCLSAETLKVEPHNAYYLDTYGFILLRLNRLDDARHFFDKALEEKPDYDDPLEHLGDVAYGKGNATAAKDFWQRALAVSRTFPNSEHLRRKLAGQADDFDQHPPFKLDSSGFGKDCAMPTV